MTVYIAAPGELISDAAGLRSALALEGIKCSARWIDDGVADDSHTAAQGDLDDIDAADVLVALNPEDWRRSGTGGRHVEFGYAVAKGKTIVLVGARTNVFHRLSYVIHVHDLSQAGSVLSRLSAEYP